MASIIRSKDGRKAIQFTSKDGRRPIIRLGKMSEKALAQTHVHVERLIQASIENIAPAPATSAWVADLGDTIHGKLVKAGLVEPRQKVDDPDAMTLGGLLEWFVEERGKTRKPGTLLLWQQASKALKDYFGADKLIADISEGDTESWRTWMLTAPRSVSNPKPVAVNTARRRCGMARQFFKAAVRKRWILTNPFDSLEGVTVRANRTRDHFISREDAEKILAVCPDQQWRMIFALSRFGGLRCPSETLALRWSDVLWDQNKIRVPSPKTAHHEGKAERMIPLFPELRQELSDGWEIAAPGCEFVITRYRDPRQNLRTTFEKIIRRAGLTPWPKLLHNLRASR